MGGNALQEAVVVSMGGVCPLGAERVGRGPSSYRGRGGSHPEGRSHTARPLGKPLWVMGPSQCYGKAVPGASEEVPHIIPIVSL